MKRRLADTGKVQSELEALAELDAVVRARQISIEEKLDMFEQRLDSFEQRLSNFVEKEIPSLLAEIQSLAERTLEAERKSCK